MFTKEELLVIEDALNIADEKYIKLMEESKNNKNKLVAYNRKQKKLWLVQNKLKKLTRRVIKTSRKKDSNLTFWMFFNIYIYHNPPNKFNIYHYILKFWNI